MTQLLDLNLPIQNPTWIFFLVLLVILMAPLVFNRLRIPHIIGMILAGVLIGEHGLNLLERDASFEIFGKVGMYYIMFLAGLEIDMEGFKQNLSRGIKFGILTTVIPFAFGFVSGFWLLGYPIATSLLLACIFGSHTLVSYPIISRYGLQRNPAVSISIAATMIALLTALLALAVLSGRYRGTNDMWFWTFFIIKFVAYFTGLFFIFPRIIRWFFQHFRDRVVQFTFVITMVFFAAVMAELCGIEGLVGAFMAGLIFNRFIPRTIPLMNRIEFVGNALFIPYFLVGVGMLVNLKPLFTDTTAMLVALVIVLFSTCSKLIASHLAGLLFKFSAPRRLMMFGLTEAHAAGAIAMVMVGTNLEIAPGVPLMSNAVLDGVVVMILISCVISSIATDAGARRLTLSESKDKTEDTDIYHGDDEKIIVTLKDPHSIENIIHTAIMMRNTRMNRGLICLNVVNDNDRHKTDEYQKMSNECLAKAHEICTSADVPVQVQSRLAVNLVNGVVHSLRENNASEIIIGMHRQLNNDKSLLGSFAQGLLQGMARQVIIVRYNMPVNTIRKIHVAVPNDAEYEEGFHRWVERLARMAEQIGCKVDYWASGKTLEAIRSYNQKYHKSLRGNYMSKDSWKDISPLRESVNDDHLLVVVSARPDSVSYQKPMTKLSKNLQEWFSSCNLMVIFPDQLGNNTDSFSLFNPINQRS